MDNLESVMLRLILSWGAAIFAFIAAFYWFRSTIAVVLDPNVSRGASAFGPAGMTVNGIDLGATARLQARWNRIAALSAGMSALFQGICLIP